MEIEALTIGGGVMAAAETDLAHRHRRVAGTLEIGIPSVGPVEIPTYRMTDGTTAEMIGTGVGEGRPLALLPPTPLHPDRGPEPPAAVAADTSIDR